MSRPRTATNPVGTPDAASIDTVMLFLLNANGVRSIAPIVHVG